MLVFVRQDSLRLMQSCRPMSILINEQLAPQNPFVHIGDNVLQKGKWSISKHQPNSCHIEDKKPAYRSVSSNYIFDRTVARKLAQYIVPCHSVKNVFVEINPGIGCLTAELLNNGLHNLHLIEGNQNFADYLKNYKEVSNSVSICNQRFAYFGDAVAMSSLWVNQLQADYSWGSDAQASIFSIIPPRQERFLIPWLVNMISNFHSYGRFKYFFVISDRLLWRCTNADISTSKNFKHYTVGHMLATTLFDIKLLTKFQKSDFVPPIALSHVEQNAKSNKTKSNFEAHQMALALIEPRRDLCEKLQLQDSVLFAAFLRQITARRHARVIPTLERLLPGVGLCLLDIEEITSPCTRIGDLRPESFLQIFQIMKKSPHFVPELFLPNSNQQQQNHLAPLNETDKSKELENDCFTSLRYPAENDCSGSIGNSTLYHKITDDEYEGDCSLSNSVLV